MKAKEIPTRRAKPLPKALRNEQMYYNGEFGVNNQIFFCGVPFRLDSYSGCSHGCRYCFARSAELTNQSITNRKISGILPAEPRHFQRQLAIALDQGLKRADINIEWLRHRVPIHWGGMSDPFQPCEKKYQVTKKWLEYLNWYNYPVAISTKGTGLLTSEPYFSLVKQGNYVVQITLLSDDPIIQQLEPGAPTPEERKQALAKLAEAGIFTVVRIQPVIPNSVIEQDLPEFIHRLSKLGVKHVLCEGYKVQVRNNEWQNEVWKLFPEALKEYNYNDVASFGFEKLLPSWRKWQYVKVAKQAANENGMTFGAADNDLRDTGDTICCCGLDDVPGFGNFWRYQASQAAWIARGKGYVTLNDLESWSGGDGRVNGPNTIPENQFVEKIRECKWTGGLGEVAEQAGAMRNYANAKQLRTTAKYCIDYMWNQGGDCSPEVMASMKKTQVDGQVAYKWTDPVPMLEAKQVKQIDMFELIG